MKCISCQELYKVLNENLNIIDIRSDYEYKKGHIQSSINIPYKILINCISNYLNSSLVYYIICDTGKISKIVCDLLENKRYNIINVLGGYDNWSYELIR